MASCWRPWLCCPAIPFFITMAMLTVLKTIISLRFIIHTGKSNATSCSRRLNGFGIDILGV